MLPLIPQPAWIPPRSLRGATSFQVPLLFPRSRALSLLSPNISCLPLHFHTGSTAGATDFRSIPTLNAQFMDPWRDPPLLQVSTFALGSRKSWLTTAFTSENGKKNKTQLGSRCWQREMKLHCITGIPLRVLHWSADPRKPMPYALFYR